MKQRKKQGKTAIPPSSSLWLYGTHACIAALKNPKRNVLQALVTANAMEGLHQKNLSFAVLRQCKVVTPREVDTALPPGSVHQGIALKVSPLPSLSLESLLEEHPTGPLVILDQVTDPQNIGAILRSAAAFGAAAVLLTDRNAPLESGTVAKAASGALEVVPLVRLPNLAKAMETLKTHGYWCIGLDGYAEETLNKAFDFPKVALLLGAEGKGLRRLTKDTCDLLVKLPMSDKVESLNVSNAAAVMLYALACGNGVSGLTK